MWAGFPATLLWRLREAFRSVSPSGSQVHFLHDDCTKYPYLSPHGLWGTQVLQSLTPSHVLLSWGLQNWSRPYSSVPGGQDTHPKTSRPWTGSVGCSGTWAHTHLHTPSTHHYHPHEWTHTYTHIPTLHLHTQTHTPLHIPPPSTHTSHHLQTHTHPIYTNIHTDTHTRTSIHTHTHIPPTHTNSHPSEHTITIYTHIPPSIDTHTPHLHKHAHTYTHMYIYTHTYPYPLYTITTTYKKKNRHIYTPPSTHTSHLYNHTRTQSPTHTINLKSSHDIMLLLLYTTYYQFFSEKTQLWHQEM